MPDADPKSDLKIRSVPRSVRLALHAQAVARGLTYAQYLAWLVEQQERLSHIQMHQEEYRATPYDLHPWGPAVKIGE